MEYLAGLKEYLHTNYDRLGLEQAHAQGTWHVFHLHGRRVLPARILDSQTYSATLEDEQGNHLTVHKTAIKFFHSLEEALEIVERIKFDRQVRSRKLLPIISARDRHFIKNKSLYPLMLEREVLFFTLLEGEILRGVVQGFNRFEIRVNLKSGLPVTIMRHALYEVQGKKGRSFLKPVQDKMKEWKKSQYYVTAQG